MPDFSLSINIKSQSDVAAVRLVDEMLARVEQSARDLDRQLQSLDSSRADRIFNSLSGGARDLNDRLLVASRGARETRDSLEQVGDAGQEAAQGLQQATRSAGDAGRAAELAGQSAQSSGLKWANVAGALYTVQAAYRAVREGAELAYRTVREGAELDWGERRFENLAQAIGSSGEQLLAAMNQTTRGLLSQAEAMGMASDLIGLKLVETEEEASRLAGVVAGLGMNLNHLTLALTNQTTARFDQLGVAVGGFEERLKRLEAQGLSTDKAFLWAFIEQAEESMARAGSRADELAGKLDILEAAWADAVAGFKRNAAESAEPIIDWLVDIIEKAKEAQNEIDRLKQGTPEDPTTADDWLRFIRGLDADIGTGVQANVVGQLDEMTGVQLEAITNYARLIDSAEEFERAMLNGYEPSRKLFQTIPEGTITWASIYKNATEAQRAFFRAHEIDSLQAFHAYTRLIQQAEQADTAMLNSARAATSGLVRQREAVGDYTSALDELARQGREVAQSTQEEDRWFREVQGRIEMKARHTALLNAHTTDYVATLEELARNGREGIETLDLTASEMEETAAAATALDEVMAGLEETTLSYFETLRQGQEIDPAEHLYEQALAMGLTAEQAADLLVAQGVMTREWADQQVAAANLVAEIDRVAASYADESITAEQASEATRLLSEGYEDNAEDAIRAAKYGSLFAGTLESEVSPSLRTGRDAALEYGDALGGIPEDVRTEVETPGLPEATTAVQDHDTALRNLPEDVTTEIETPGLSEAEESVLRFGDYLANLPRSVTTTVTTLFEQQGTPYSGPYDTYAQPGSPAPSGPGIPEYATGTDGWLRIPGPAGAPYLFRAHGGELMNIVPEGRPAGGGAYYDQRTINHHYNSAGAVAMAEAMYDAERMKARNAFMGE